ncbi:MAG: ECF-type sigma factor [Verrucomicrobiota bacterium]|jgi:RNA polymerase sigma factor (TIGR02999 family)
MSEITQMLQSVPSEGSSACEELLPLVYGGLRRLAAARMAQESPGQTLQPTALVHEAWVRIHGNGERRWQNRAHFFREASEAMRRILIENARRKSRLKRFGGQIRLDIDELELAATATDDKVLLINDALEQLELENPEMARVVVLKFFGGLSNQETAETIGVARRTVERQWTFAKAWLFRCIRKQM